MFEHLYAGDMPELACSGAAPTYTSKRCEFMKQSLVSAETGALSDRALMGRLHPTMWANSWMSVSRILPKRRKPCAGAG